jgi:fatty acid desaturase
MTKTTRSPRPASNAGARERIQLPDPAVSRWMNHSVLRKRADLGPVVFVLMIASVQGFLFLQSSVLVAAFGAAVLWPIQTRTIYIAHNHHHHPIFRVRSLNLLFETLLFLQTGMPSFGFPLHHNRGHHVSYRNQNPGHSDATTASSSAVGPTHGVFFVSRCRRRGILGYGTRKCGGSSSTCQHSTELQ